MIEVLRGKAAVARSGDIAHILARSFESTSQHWPTDSVAATLAAPGAVALVAAEGCALVRVAADEAELLTIAVTPAARGRGLGARLLAACVAAAAEGGATRVHLEVGAGNAPAIALYEAAGFARAGLRPGYYAGPGGREDAVLMSRAIAPAGGVSGASP